MMKFMLFSNEMGTLDKSLNDWQQRHPKATIHHIQFTTTHVVGRSILDRCLVAYTEPEDSEGMPF